MARALKMGPVNVERRLVPPCRSCSSYGRDWRCNCGGSGFFFECDRCPRQSVKEWDHVFVVSTAKADYHVCAACLGATVESAIPAVEYVMEGAA